MYVDGNDLIAEDDRGNLHRAALGGARSVRVVPLTRGDHHARTGPGWQVTLAQADGDVLLGRPLSDWQAARDLARQVCEAAHLPLDELTQKMFSRVGQYTTTQQ